MGQRAKEAATGVRNASEKKAEPRRCFVISPIGSAGSDIRDRADDVRDYVVKPAVEPLGYRVERADDIADPGMIMQQVVDAIVEAELVVADLTALNPNVLYELAIRHETGKPVITIAERGTDVPFDLNQVRTIFFDHTNLRSVHRCQDHIREQALATERAGFQPHNPIVNAKSMKAWKASGDSNVQRDVSIMQMLQDVSSGLSTLTSHVHGLELSVARLQADRRHRVPPPQVAPEDEEAAARRRRMARSRGVEMARLHNMLTMLEDQRVTLEASARDDDRKKIETEIAGVRSQLNRLQEISGTP